VVYINGKSHILKSSYTRFEEGENIEYRLISYSDGKLCLNMESLVKATVLEAIGL
jgi:hypothetical protein